VKRALIAMLAALASAYAYAVAPDLGSDADRKAGAALYDKLCSQCHGVHGDGTGYAAQHLKPRPRNFTTGKFKIRTTPSGALPTTDDLKHIIKTGMPYTSMPAWPNFTDSELTQLAYYVKSFSPDFAKPDFNMAPLAFPKAPKYTKESAETGRKVYEATGCIKCHGELGRGDGPSARTLADDWGYPLKPADFTQRYTFRGGATREDIFRTMTTGLNGTPMPAFGDALKPEERWAITDYIYSLSGSDEPGYATLVTAKHVDEAIDLAKGAAAFGAAPVARIPIVGQIMEPGREFHPPVVSVLVQAIYDSTDIAFCVRWNDMSAETAGSNSPALVVPIEEEEEAQEGAGAAAAAETDEWGEAKKPAAPADPWGEAAAPAAGATPAGAFSDAVAIQLPLQLPGGARKPYFLFGDAGDPVDLWFFDLAQNAPQQYVGKGSASLMRNDTGELSGAASFTDGEWSVVYKWPLHPTTGVLFEEGQFVPVAFSVWDGFTRERGNRRALTVWYHLYVEPVVVESPVGPMLKTAGFVVAAEILAIFAVRRSLTGKSSAV
jgi:mono/diheme cytochrome c family protein